MSWHHLRIKGKILCALLLMSLLTFSIICALALMNMRKLGTRMSDALVALGASAVKDSKDMLYAKSEKQLQSLVRDQAAITNLLLDRISSEIDNAARIYAGFLNEVPVAATLSAMQNEKGGASTDFGAFSYYKCSPDITETELNRELRIMDKMSNIMKLMMANSRYLELIYVGTAKGVFFEYPWMPLPQDYDPRGRPWYHDATHSKVVEWTGPYVSSSKKTLVITCSKAIYDKDGKPFAVIAADINVKVISQDFISTQLEDKGHAFLIDEKGNVLAREGLSDKQLKWDSFQKENLFEMKDPELKELAAKMIAGKKGIAKFKSKDDVEQYIAYAPVPVAEWSVAVAMPVEFIIESAVNTEKRINEETRKTRKFISRYIREKQITYIAVGLLILAGIAVVGIILSNKITRPILALELEAKKIGDGNLDRRLEINTGDEIQDLAATFNKMTDDLKLYIKNLQETVIAKERIEADLKVANRIQTSMLPRVFPPFPDRHEFDIFASMQPAKEVGGDFYDFFFIDKNKFFFCIGDVSGKGVPGALFMAITNTLIRGVAASGAGTDEILCNVNNILEKNNDDCMFATVFCGILDVETGELQYSNAGHNPPVIRRESKEYEFLNVPNGIVIGPIVQQREKYPVMRLKLKPGDMIFLYTDGVTEAMDKDKALFGERRMLNELNLTKTANLNEIINRINAAILRHAGEEPQFDDITMLVLKFRGGTAARGTA